MNVSVMDFSPAYAEIFVLVMACTILVVDLFLPDRHRAVSYNLAMLTLAGAALITASQSVDTPVLTLSGTFVADSMGDVLKLFSYLIVAVVFLYSRDYLRRGELFKGEYFVLGLFALIRVFRVLDLLFVMDAFQIKAQISPIELAKLEGEKRQRARTKSNQDKPES